MPVMHMVNAFEMPFSPILGEETLVVDVVELSDGDLAENYYFKGTV